MAKKRKFFKTIILSLIFIDLALWSVVIFSNSSSVPEIYFLNVGQGDSSLISFGGPASLGSAMLGGGGVNFLIDGGPMNGKLDGELFKVLGSFQKRLDIVFISHPEIDHFGGILDISSKYDIGAVVYNGAAGTGPNWEALMQFLKNKKIPLIPLKAGSLVRYIDGSFDVIHSASGSQKTGNENALVLKFSYPGIKAVFSGDIGFGAEKEILADGKDLLADILKVAHHGSKYSSGSDFLKAVSPKISIIEVGKNSYGHPTPEALKRLSLVNSKIYRTDTDGTIKITKNNDVFQIFSLK